VARWDAVLGFHTNPLTCGVAKFNAELARRLGIPFTSVASDDQWEHALVSVKPSEGEIGEIPATKYDLLLHEVGGSSQSESLRQRAAQIILAPIIGCPPTFNDTRARVQPDIAVLSFGMSYKLIAKQYLRLAEVLKRSGRQYALYLSAALHEGTAFDGSFQQEVADLQALYNGQVYFLGYLSDFALQDELLKADYCAAFFSDGVRANNTSVHAAMRCGAVVITNLDRDSPDGFRHGETMLNIEQLTVLPAMVEHRRIQLAARQLFDAEYSWDAWMAKFLKSGS